MKTFRFIQLAFVISCCVMTHLSAVAQEVDSSRVRAQVQMKRQLEIEAIARHVAQAVLAGNDSLRTEQYEVVKRVATQLALDVEFFEEQHKREQARREERKELITSIILNVAKGVAIIVALLVLRAIIGAIGRGVATEENRAALLGVLITARTQTKARDIGRKLVEEDLATGGTVAPSIRSIYRREDGIREASEAMVLLKTTYAELPDLMRRVEDLGGDAVPEIIALSRSMVE